MKYTLVVFGISFVCIGGYLIFELGKPILNEEGKVVRDEFSDLPVVKQYFYRTLKELDYYKRVCRELRF